MATRWPPRIIYNDDTCTLRTAPEPHTVDSINVALDYPNGPRRMVLPERRVAVSWAAL